MAVSRFSDLAIENKLSGVEVGAMIDSMRLEYFHIWSCCFNENRWFCGKVPVAQKPKMSSPNLHVPPSPRDPALT